MASDGVLLTGATGFVGMQLLARYLERTDRHVYALVRGSSGREAAEKLERVLRLRLGRHHPYANRVTPVRGDITEQGMGLGDGVDALAESVGEIVHSAASVSFDQDLPAARAINVEGTRRVLELAQRCERRGGLRRLSYISTAYVCGDRRGCFSEDELDVGQSFRNAYEQSKFEAELLIRRSDGRLPVTVLRPSIIVGERASGWTTSFNVLYWPIRAYTRGAYAMLPARASCPVDVVPVDYVADAAMHLTQARAAEGGTFHLTAGRCASSVAEIVELTAAFFGRSAPRLLSPSLYRRTVHPVLLAAADDRTRRALRRSEVFFPYFSVDATFDERRTRVALCGTGIRPAPLRSYFGRLVEFALEAEWGRREIPHPCGVEHAELGEWPGTANRSALASRADGGFEDRHTEDELREAPGSGVCSRDARAGGRVGSIPPREERVDRERDLVLA